MKSSRKFAGKIAGAARRIACATVLAAAAVWALPQWVQNIPAVRRFEGVFFTRVDLPSGPVMARRQPRETRAALDQLVTATPTDAELYALRAQAAEEQLEVAAAEADWKRFAELAPDAGAGHLALADFYHRQLRLRQELSALEAAAQAANPPSDRYLTPSRQRSWRTLERAVALVNEQALAVETGAAEFRLWMKLYPKERAVYQRYFSWLIGKKQIAEAGQAIALYEKAFPDDRVFPVSARALIEKERGGVEQALEVYDQAFEPLWPPELLKEYFALLEQTHNLRRYLGRANAALAANPSDVNAAVRLFYYHQQQGNLPAAQRVLVEVRQRKTAWSAAELWTLGRLMEGVHNYDEAARNYHALYALAGASADDQRRALGALISLLFAAADQPIRFGAGDLSYYRDIATIDPHPGFLNGILSLILNSTGPQYEFAEQERTGASYFHRVRAAELLRLFDRKFPAASERAALHAQLVESYAAYGASDGVIAAARQFLAVFPKASQRTEVALRMAEAFARKDDAKEEFATYDGLLKELAERAEGVPLGEGAPVAAYEQPGPPETGEGEETAEPEEEGPAVAPRPVAHARVRFAAEQRAQAAGGPRSPDYARVLDRYIARLLSMKRRMEVLALLRRELDRNPNDAGLYERVALFLDQNRLEAELEQVYQRAIKQFATVSWYDKLGRWYLRRRYAAGLEQLSRQVVDTFSGTDLARYFSEVASGTAALTPQLFLKVNLYAHARFPYNLTFVHNLVSAYSTRGTADASARQALLREYWFYDDSLRRQYFELLSRQGRLVAELERLPAATVEQNPAAVRFVAEAEIWRSHYEQAAPALEAVASQFPGNAELAGKAVALDRSLAAYDAHYTERAAARAEKLYQADRRDHARLTEIGEIYADRELYARARPHWNALANLEPGSAAGYLEAATVFWDYFLYDDALRLIGEGRQRLGNPALYAYEAGAIYENKRQYESAVAEYVKGSEPGSAARARLVALAKRPATRGAIDKLTGERVAGANPDENAVSLRLAVLDAGNRRADAEQLLLGLAARASSPDLLAYVRGEGERRGLDAVAERAFEREIAVTGDPIERMRARLALVRFYEARNDVTRARAALEELYRGDPNILGVVRAAVDFYWRNRLRREAVETLARAAAAANAVYRPQFLLEAEAKAAEAGESGRARELAAELLKADPLRPEYIAAMADALARAGDDRALGAFYEEKIQAIRGAPLAPEENTARLATLRRGLIPVLTRLKDYTGGVDQYIEVVKSYPEDEGVAREAAAYASDHNARERLRGYFERAVADSPRDFRWPMALARIDAFFEDLPAAIAAYAKATAIRPDRVDLRVARAAIEERLMRFDEALASYTKLYELTYRNPRWMEKAAEIHARRGERAAAVQALRAAFLDGRPERPQPFFEAARLLDGWNLLAEAREFAERGATLAGKDLVVDYQAGAIIYARIMTRLREPAKALETVTAAEHEPSQLTAVCGEIGRTMARYFTPEEKTAAEAWLDKARFNVPDEPMFALVEQAGLGALEAKWRFAALMAVAGHGENYEPLRRLIELERARMRFDELGAQMEAYWRASQQRQARSEVSLERAADAYRAGGSRAAELRVLALHQQYTTLPPAYLERYFELLVAHAPEQLVAEAGGGTVVDGAANAAMESGKAALAFDAVRARGRALPRVWTRAYIGLTGLYYGDRSNGPLGELAAALGEQTVGAQLGNRVDRNQQLAGGVWFYYGTAYGQYLGQVGDLPHSEDYLPAYTEGRPAWDSAYVALAKHYREAGDGARALSEYDHALELNPDRGDVLDAQAVLLWDGGRHDEAVARWKQAFVAFRRTEDARLPVSFWDDLRAALEHIGARGLLAQVRGEADAALRLYIRRNGSYRLEPLMEGALAAGGADAAGWLADLSRAAQDPISILESAINLKQLGNEQREVLLRRAIDIAAAEASQPGPQHAYARERLETLQSRWIVFLADTRQTARAQAAIEALPEMMRHSLWGVELRVAAQAGRLAELLENCRRDPACNPQDYLLRNTAAQLERDGDAVNARRLLEFLYTRELERRNLTAANFLGLAEVRLGQGDLPAALALLRRMALVAGEPFENLAPAADLLEKTGHAAEAREFLTARAKAAPWDLEARARLAEAGVARLPEAPYAARATAARLGGGANLGGGELDLLATRAPIAPKAASQPLFYYARLKAAEDTNDPKQRLPLLGGAIAINPGPHRPRLELFRAALAAREYQLAISAVQPLLGNLQWTYEYLNRERDETVRPYDGFSGELAKTERAELARGLGQAYESLGELRRALFSDQVAAEIAPAPELRAAVDRLEAEQARRERNGRRRPVISSGLEQDHLVEPRLAGGIEK